MKFSHMADCHIGGWRDPKMKELPILAFEKAVDISISKAVDFVLISGDLFNTSIPDISLLKRVVQRLTRLKETKIPVYMIAGSHDFSPSGKTMLSVLEEAGLCINVVKGKVIDKKLVLDFVKDEKTKAKITGMIGKKGMLEKSYYETLDRKSLEDEPGFKIFMFHTAITELKPKELAAMESSPVSLLPKGFDYYAGGHVHIVKEAKLDGYKDIVYPGPLFPNNFKELEELKGGGFYIFEDGKAVYQPVLVKNVFSIEEDAEAKTPEEVRDSIVSKIRGKEFFDTLVLIRLRGNLLTGRIMDIGFQKIFDYLYERSAYHVMKNTYSLAARELEEIKVKQEDIDTIEQALIGEHVQKFNPRSWDKEKETRMTQELMRILSSQKKEGERNYEYDDRLRSEAAKILKISL